MNILTIDDARNALLEQFYELEKIAEAVDKNGTIDDDLRAATAEHVHSCKQIIAILEEITVAWCDIRERHRLIQLASENVEMMRRELLGGA